MKIKDLKGYVSPRTIEDLEVPIEHAVVHDEFNRRGSSGDHRDRAVNRLIDLRVGFSSEWNTTFHLAKAFLIGECPYCHGPMDIHHGGGSGSRTNIEFRCTNNECGAKGSVRVDWDAVSMQPPKKGKYNREG